MLSMIWESMRRDAVRLLHDDEGAGTVEVIMIIAVVIIVALLFRDQLKSMVEDLMDKATKKADGMFN